MKDPFFDCHPLVNFIYFALVLAFSMCFMHPACLLISLVSALLCALTLEGRKAVRFSLLAAAPLLLLTALLNPAFNHAGGTVLTYLPSGNPLTLESVAYGVAAGTMLAAVLLWFRCCTLVLTSDKFVYLFGRVIPSLSLVLSMALRFVPRFIAQLRAVGEAQRCMGRDASTGGLLRRVKAAGTVLSITVTWALENAVGTADSMKSRGYGLPGRTAFSIYRFDRRDKRVLVWLALSGGYVLTAALAGGLRWRYFPTVQGAMWNPVSVSAWLAYLALCLTPVTLRLQNARLWRGNQGKEASYESTAGN